MKIFMVLACLNLFLLCDGKLFIGDCNKLGSRFCGQLCDQKQRFFFVCKCKNGFALEQNGRTCLQVSSDVKVSSSDDMSSEGDADDVESDASSGDYSGNYKIMTTNCDNEDGDCEDVVVSGFSGFEEESIGNTPSLKVVTKSNFEKNDDVKKTPLVEIIGTFSPTTSTSKGNRLSTETVTSTQSNDDMIEDNINVFYPIANTSKANASQTTVFTQIAFVSQTMDLQSSEQPSLNIQTSTVSTQQAYPKETSKLKQTPTKSILFRKKATFSTVSSTYSLTRKLENILQTSSPGIISNIVTTMPLPTPLLSTVKVTGSQTTKTSTKCSKEKLKSTPSPHLVSISNKISTKHTYVGTSSPTLSNRRGNEKLSTYTVGTKGYSKQHLFSSVYSALDTNSNVIRTETTNFISPTPSILINKSAYGSITSNLPSFRKTTSNAFSDSSASKSSSKSSPHVSGIDNSIFIQPTSTLRISLSSATISTVIKEHLESTAFSRKPTVISEDNTTVVLSTTKSIHNVVKMTSDKQYRVDNASRINLLTASRVTDNYININSYTTQITQKNIIDSTKSTIKTTVLGQTLSPSVKITKNKPIGTIKRQESTDNSLAVNLIPLSKLILCAIVGFGLLLL